MPDYASVLQQQRDFFATGKTLDLAFRLDGLRRLYSAIQQNEQEILAALHADLGKCPAEAFGTEVGFTLMEATHTIRHLRQWARPKRAAPPLVNMPCSCRVEPEPYGVALIMSPWNYPFQLTLAPLIAALAAGNTAVVKPSAYAPATSAIIGRLLGRCFPQDYVAVFEGGREANRALLAEQFDTIFFTGSVEVGKTVMEAASRHLTPVTLELGGKSPCVVCKDTDIALAARRIVWGKTVNSGQTCVAPDYVLAHRDVLEPLAEEMKKCIAQFFGPNPLTNPEYPRIVNEKHFDRVAGYLKDGQVYTGGRLDRAARKIEPTILLGVTPGSPVMQEEIFGPVLPVLPFTSTDEVAQFINSRPKPLAFYLFTKSSQTERELLRRVSSGGCCVNDTVMHLAAPSLPFGGVGDSGMGHYHGRWGFDTFTHWRGVLRKANRPELLLRYPPYGGKLDLFRKFQK